MLEELKQVREALLFYADQPSSGKALIALHCLDTLIAGHGWQCKRCEEMVKQQMQIDQLEEQVSLGKPIGPCPEYEENKHEDFLEEVKKTIERMQPPPPQSASEGR